MFIIACCIPRGSQPAWLLRRFSQATIRTADGAATLIGPAQRNFARRRWRGKVDGVSWQTGDGPHLWSGPSKWKGGRHLEKDRAGGKAEMSRQRGRREISATRFQWRGGQSKEIGMVTIT